MSNVASTLKQKLGRLLSQLPWLSRGLVLAWQSSRPWTVAWLVLLGPWLSAALFISVIPALWVVVHFNVVNYKWRQRITEDERRAWYYNSLLTQGESAAELRLFALGEHFRSTGSREFQCHWSLMPARAFAAKRLNAE